MQQQDTAEPTAAGASEAVRHFGLRHWMVLIVLSAASCVGYLWIARLMQWPVYLRSSASLIAGPRVGAGVAAVAIGMLATVVVSTLLLGWVRVEAGLFAAAAGLGAMACIGGTVGAVLREGMGAKVYQAFITDTVLLFALTGVAAQVMSALAKMLWHPHPVHDPDREEQTTFPRMILATLAQAVVMALLVELLAQTDAMKQVMAAVFVAAVVGGVIAHQLVPIATAAAFWVGPFVVAVGGYVWAYRVPGRVVIGVPANPLASVPPMAYASLGVAGALLGYWTSRKWREMDDEEIPEDALD